MSAKLSYSQAYRAGLVEEMTENAAIFVMGTDIFLRGGHFAQVLGLGEKFGVERIRDVPISEAAMVAAGVGAALQGMRPIVDLNFLDFSFGCMDELCNQAAKIHYMFNIPVPLVVRATNGVAYGGAQHNNVIDSWFAEMPGLNVAVPSTPRDVKGLIKSSLRLDDPVLFLMDKSLTGIRGEVGGPWRPHPAGPGRRCSNRHRHNAGQLRRECPTLPPGGRHSRRARYLGGDHRLADALPPRLGDGLCLGA